MEGLLHHQNSTASFQKNYKRCMWDWLRFFDLHHHLSVRKLLEDGGHGDHGGHAGRVKIPYVPLSANGHDDLDDEANLLIVNKGNQTKRGSGKASVRALIFKKLFRKHHHKQKALPMTPHLMRTISIHHLECSDVLPVEMTSETDTLRFGFSSQKTHSSESNQHIPPLPEIKKCQVCGTMNIVNHAGQHNHLTEKQAELELFNAPSESFLEIVEDPNLVLENCCQDLHRSSSGRILLKSGLFPVVKSLVQTPTSVSSTMDYDLHSMLSKGGTDEDTPQSEPAVVYEHSAYYSSEFLPRSSRSRNVKKKLKDATNENRKEHLHISMDGLLHKIPHGQTVYGDVIKEKLFRSASARYYRESTRDNVSIPPKVHLHQSFRRSHSLTESSDRYTHVFESISARESKRLPECLTSAEVDLGLQDRKTPEIFGRNHYSPEFRSFPSKDVPHEPLHGSLLSEAAPINPLEEDEAIDIYALAELKSGDTHVNIKESIETNIVLEQTLDVDAGGTLDGELELPLIRNELIENEACRVSCVPEENIGCISLPKQEFLDQQESHIELHQSEVQVVSDSSRVGDGHGAHEGGLKIDSNDGSAKPTPTSVLDLDFEDDLSGPATYEFSEDSEIEPRSLHFEELDFLVKKHNALVSNDSDEMDTADSNFGKKQPEVFANIDKFHTQVDQKDETDFNYVRDVLRRSSFDGFKLVEPQYSNQLIGPFLSGELCPSSDELEVASYDSSDVSPAHQVLHELINEILLDVSEKFSIHRWCSRFDSHIRTMPMECNVLEEVWRKISSHLSSQTHQTQMYESVMARDFAKDDGWLNLQQDAVCLGVELEILILDDLVDELILDFW